MYKCLFCRDSANYRLNLDKNNRDRTNGYSYLSEVMLVLSQLKFPISNPLAHVMMIPYTVIAVY